MNSLMTSATNCAVRETGRNALIAGLAAILVTFAGGPAKAQDGSNWYVALGGGLSLREDSKGTIANAPTAGQTVHTLSPFEPGFGGQLALERRFGNVRLEGELGYSRDHQNRYEAVVPATGQIFADVTEERVRVMANAYFDFPTKAALRPYLGAGVGWASTDLLFIGPRAPVPTEQPLRLIDDSDAGFAWQLMAGVAAPVGDRLEATVQYRWFDGGTFEGVDSRNQPALRDISGHNVDVGLRMRF